MIPNNKDLKKYIYHLNQCCKTFIIILALKKVDTKTISKRENGGPSEKPKLKTYKIFAM